jgi:hypothetical protein
VKTVQLLDGTVVRLPDWAAELAVNGGVGEYVTKSNYKVLAFDERVLSDREAKKLEVTQ